MAAAADPMANSDIHLYTAKTPNGIKVSMLLEELGLPYKVTELSFSKNEQKEAWYVDNVNPNGRIPAITDVLPDGTPVRVFESGAVLLYLVERYDVEGKFRYPRGNREDLEVLSWVCFSLPLSRFLFYFYWDQSFLFFSFL